VLNPSAADQEPWQLPFYLKVTFTDFGRLLSSLTASVVYWPEFMAANPEVPGSIPGTTRFSE
jgi:hypothetical protein